MMDAQLVTQEGLELVPADAGKDARYRLGRYEAWASEHGLPWHDPDLETYRDAMLQEGYARSTVAAHLSTLRGRYRRLATDNRTRERLYRMASGRLEGIADRKAFVDETLQRIHNAIDPENTRVKQVTRQDTPDSDHLRLTPEQANALLAAPGLGDRRGIRDTAIIATLLCTGIREAELTALRPLDLRRRVGGELALHVREGKGAKERLVPYGELDWVLAILDLWLDERGAGAPEFVFCGYYKGYRIERPGPLSVRAVQNILARYPVTVDGELRTVCPHDLRRTYARCLYLAGTDLVAIQQNLGHADSKTTLGYIGPLDASDRRAPAVFTFDLSKIRG